MEYWIQANNNFAMVHTDPNLETSMLPLRTYSILFLRI